LLRKPHLTPGLIVLSAFVWMFEGAVFASIAYQLNPESARMAPWFALATGTLSTLLPISPGYVGTFHYFAMLGLAAYGADPERAAAFAVAVHAILWIPLTLIGVSYFFRPGERPSLQQISHPTSSEENSE
jgi:uncharacterized membrane protein YbhN (UPF0104 family)